MAGITKASTTTTATTSSSSTVEAKNKMEEDRINEYRIFSNRYDELRGRIEYIAKGCREVPEGETLLLERRVLQSLEKYENILMYELLLKLRSTQHYKMQKEIRDYKESQAKLPLEEAMPIDSKKRKADGEAKYANPPADGVILIVCIRRDDPKTNAYYVPASKLTDSYIRDLVAAQVASDTGVYFSPHHGSRMSFERLIDWLDNVLPAACIRNSSRLDVLSTDTPVQRTFIIETFD